MNIHLCIFILRRSQENACSERDKFAFDRIMTKIHFCVLSKPMFPHLPSEFPINFKMCGLQYLECRAHLKGAEIEKH